MRNGFETIFTKTVKHKWIHEASVLIEHGEHGLVYQGEYNQTIDTPILLASVTKLLTTACIFILVDQKQLSLDDPITHVLDKSLLKGMCKIEGTDYTDQLTIKWLLSQQSGLPDYYLKGKDALFNQVLKGDFSYTINEMVNKVKTLKPMFKPGSKSKAYYADINFDLLGLVIEVITNKPLKEAYNQLIAQPLKLKHTYLMDQQDAVPHSYYKNKKFERPLFLSSCFASGGAVSTTRELMKFLKAFWQGKLFDLSHLEAIDSKPLQMSFYPIQYGLGYMQMKASLPFKKSLDLLGHSGSTGSFAFYAKALELYIVGDLRQVKAPAKPIRLVMKLALTDQKEIS